MPGTLTREDISSIVMPIVSPLMKAQEKTEEQMSELAKSINKLALIEDHQGDCKLRVDALASDNRLLWEKIYRTEIEISGMKSKVTSSSGWIERALIALVVVGLAATAIAFGFISKS